MWLYAYTSSPLFGTLVFRIVTDYTVQYNNYVTYARTYVNIRGLDRESRTRTDVQAVQGQGNHSFFQPRQA